MSANLDAEELAPGFFEVGVVDACGGGAPITMFTGKDGSVVLMVGDGSDSGAEFGPDSKSAERLRMALHGLFTGRALVENYRRGKKVRVWDHDWMQVLAYSGTRGLFATRGPLMQRDIYPGYGAAPGSGNDG